ncbi:hypothetical protein Cch01nite_01110 [Cellulomonas chitinilytica]|uniref:Uncharacterized protein n=1 Tax=Cellulomonas chitinilytica TaxID=398759 RepID=A0A919U0B2_9CELL|nr:hypothetical protein [Cellulomonas chitinilytica]GIG19387.1 hypothetical protein Cch01nite_01110 [Cellulomonas chitinilytica]
MSTKKSRPDDGTDPRPDEDATAVLPPVDEPAEATADGQDEPTAVLPAVDDAPGAVPDAQEGPSGTAPAPDEEPLDGDVEAPAADLAEPTDQPTLVLAGDGSTVVFPEPSDDAPEPPVDDTVPLAAAAQAARPSPQPAATSTAYTAYTAQPEPAPAVAPPTAPPTALPVAPARPRPRLRVSTVVWGLVIATIGVGILAWASGFSIDLQLSVIVLLAAAGTALLVGSIVSGARSSRH